MMFYRQLLITVTIGCCESFPLLFQQKRQQEKCRDSSELHASRRQFLPAILGTAAWTVLTTIPQATSAVEVQQQQRLSFQTLPSGVKYADITSGTSSSPTDIVGPKSKVNVHITGRLLGKNGWIFMNSIADDAGTYKLQLGANEVVPGLEEGLQGMVEGGRRRIVVPSNVGYINKNVEPIPRDFGNRQRLYTTVMNSNRMDREREALGNDLAGNVVFDVELLRVRDGGKL